MRTGRIKLYDPDRKYGFIIPSDGGGDVMFFGSQARAAGLITVRQGQPVRYVAEGDRATAIYAVLPNAQRVYDELVTRAKELMDFDDYECREDARLMRDAAGLLIERERVAS